MMISISKRIISFLLFRRGIRQRCPGQLKSGTQAYAYTNQWRRGTKAFYIESKANTFTSVVSYTMLP